MTGDILAMAGFLVILAAFGLTHLLRVLIGGRS